MSAAVAVIFFIRPTSISPFLPRHRTPNPNRIIVVRPRLLSSATRVPHSEDKVLRCPNSTTETIRILADEGIRAMEREAFVSGSPNLVANSSGLVATLNNLSKWLVTALFALFVLWRHDAEALWDATGSVINVGLSTVLKRFLNQERPVANLRSDPEMPSSHAQSIFYITTLAVLSMVQLWGLNVFTTAVSGICLTFASYFSWLRISQQLHTISQVVVGALLGTGFSALWFWLWGSIVLKAFVSHLWVRILVILAGAAFCVVFLLYAIRYWVMEPVALYISRKT